MGDADDEYVERPVSQGGRALPLLKPLPRLKTRREFLHVAKGGKAVRSGLLIQSRASEAAGEGLRVGFTASKKVGNAVARNRAKRRLREAAQQLLPLYGVPGHDYVFIARAATGARAWTRLLDDVKSALLSLAPPASPARNDKNPSGPASADAAAAAGKDKA